MIRRTTDVYVWFMVSTVIQSYYTTVAMYSQCEWLLLLAALTTLSKYSRLELVVNNSTVMLQYKLD